MGIEFNKKGSILSGTQENRKTGKESFLRGNSVFIFPALHMSIYFHTKGRILSGKQENGSFLRIKHYSIFDGMNKINRILRCLFKPFFIYYMENDVTIRRGDVNSRRGT